jgi:hypothetical protein
MSHWDHCFFCLSLLLLLCDDQVCLNSWMNSCWFSNGIVKCTSKQMKLDHVLMYIYIYPRQIWDTNGEILILYFFFPLRSIPMRKIKRLTSYGFYPCDIVLFVTMKNVKWSFDCFQFVIVILSLQSMNTCRAFFCCIRVCVCVQLFTL